MKRVLTRIIPSQIEEIWQRLLNENSFSGQVGQTTLTNLIMGLIAFATGTLSARVLGPQGKGELTAILLYPSLIVLFAMLGMPQAIVYFGSRFPNHVSNYLTSGMVLTIPSGIISGALGWQLMPWLLKAQSPEIINASRWLLVIFLVINPMLIPHQAFRGVGAWKEWNFIRAFQQFIWLLILLPPVFGILSVNSIQISHFYPIMYLGVIIPTLIVLRKIIPPPYRIQKGLFRPLLRYGLPTVLTYLPQTINLKLDQLLIGAFLQPHLLGLYSVSVAWSGLLTPLFSSVGSVLFPSLSVMNFTQQRGMIRNTMYKTGIGLVLFTICLFLITPFCIPVIFGKNFSPAVPSALVLVIAGAFNIMNAILYEIARGLGQPKITLIAEIIGVVCTGFFLYWLLPHYDILGAAIASLVAYAVVSIFLVSAIFYFFRHQDISRSPETN